eukprot:6201161-Pleurochrysis_carterae.AAC.5
MGSQEKSLVTKTIQWGQVPGRSLRRPAKARTCSPQLWGGSFLHCGQHLKYVQQTVSKSFRMLLDAQKRL